MATINVMLRAHPCALRGFHGHIASVGEIAAFLIERISRWESIPGEMSTQAGTDALVELLLGWDLVRVRDHSPGAYGKDITDNPAYLRAPAWLREMLKHTHRHGTSITATGKHDGIGYISSLVPGIHGWRDNPIEFEATCAVIAAEIDLQFAEIIPHCPRPTHRHMVVDEHYDGCFHIDFGTINGRSHGDTIKVVGGQHASAADIALLVSEMRRDMDFRLLNASLINEGVGAIHVHVEGRIREFANVALSGLRVVGLSIGDDAAASVAVNVSIDAPDHGRTVVTETFLVWGKKHEAKGTWTMSSHDMPRVMSRLRRTARIGSVLTADRVVAAVLSRLDDGTRRRILDTVFEAPGQTLEGVQLQGTGLKRLRLHHGTLGGTVEIANGVTWVDGALRVRRKVLTLPDTVITALTGRPVNAVADHPMLPAAVITEARETGTTYRFVTDAKPAPFIR